jgi:hypothetical protein
VLTLNPRMRVVSGRWRLVAVGLTLVLFTGWLVATRLPVGQLTNAPWLLYRDQIWAAGWDLFLAKPWSGYGLGSFRTVYPSKARFDTGEVVHRAHNDWLEWAVEGGIWGPLPLILIGTMAGLRVRREPWLWGIPMVLLHSVVDYPLDRFAILLLLAALAASARGGRRDETGDQQHLRARKKVPVPPITALESFSRSRDTVGILEGC